MILRKFLFLDTDTVSEYLSQLQGSVLESFDQIESKANSKIGKINIPGIGGGDAGATQTSQITSKHKVLPEAQFHALYELLDQSNMVQFLDAFDATIWQQIQKNEIVEIQATIQIPRSYQMMEAVGNLSHFMSMLQNSNPNALGKQDNKQVIDTFIALTKTKPISLVFEPVSNDGYRFTADLSRKFIRSDVGDFQGEATVLGKISRIISEEEKFTITPFSDFMTLFDWQKSRTSGNINSINFEQQIAKAGFVEEIPGPAMKLIPIAVYR